MSVEPRRGIGMGFEWLVSTGLRPFWGPVLGQFLVLSGIVV